MIQACLRRIGLWPTIVAATLISIVVSLLIAAAVYKLVLGVPMTRVTWLLCILCPLVVAPSMSFASFSLLLKLDRAHEQLRVISDTDYLTGAYNRRYFMARLVEEVERRARGGLPFAVALIDVDNFKSVNDAHGHLAGDEVLRRLAQSCMAHVRAIDTFARFGGEEFAVLLPQTDLAQAQQWLERMRLAAAGLSFDPPGTGLGVTISIGVAAADANALRNDPAASTVDAVLRHADEALYRAKREGKNRVALPLGVA